MDIKKLESAIRLAVDGHVGSIYVAKQIMNVHGRICGEMLNQLRQDASAHGLLDDDDVEVEQLALNAGVLNIPVNSTSPLSQAFLQVVQDALAGVFAGAVVQAYISAVTKEAVLDLVSSQYDLVERALTDEPGDRFTN